MPLGSAAGAAFSPLSLFCLTISGSENPEIGQVKQVAICHRDTASTEISVIWDEHTKKEVRLAGSSRNIHKTKIQKKSPTSA